MAERTIANDYTLSWFGKRYQIPASQVRPRMRKAKLRVEQRLNGELVARWNSADITLRLCEEPAIVSSPVAQPKQPKPARSLRRPWMDGFWIGDPAKKRSVPPVTPVALRAPSVTGGTG
jgi:hypothetical protein